MTKIAGALMGGLSLLALVAFRVSAEWIWRLRLTHETLLTGGPTSFFPAIDQALLYAGVVAGAVLMVWPTKQK